MQTFRSGGKGGQNQNKRDTGVRLIHHESGARGESREERSQHQNRRRALEKLVATPQFKFWAHEKRRELEGHESAEAWVEAQMADLSNFKFEGKDSDGKWVELP